MGYPRGSKIGILFQFWLHPFLSLILSPCSRSLAFDSFLAPNGNIDNLLHPCLKQYYTPKPSWLAEAATSSYAVHSSSKSKNAAIHQKETGLKYS